MKPELLQSFTESIGRLDEILHAEKTVANRRTYS